MPRILSARSLILACAIALAPFALQAQATTTCKDGTTSAASGKGACSGHGGVAKAAKAQSKAATKAAKTEAKADAKVAKTETKADAKVAKTESKAANKAAKTTASANDAAGATAKCKDGTYSHAQSRRGACSRHGGVAEWLKT